MGNNYKKPLNVPKYRINDELYGKYDVRITGEGIESRVMPLYEAKKIAEEMQLDIIEINSKATPPIMRIASYDKMMYEMKKNAKKANKGSKPLKEIQLSVSISEHDLQTKANNARKFIESGNKVKTVLTMKGREMQRKEENKKSILEFILKLEDVAVPEGAIKEDGNKVTVILKKK